MIQSSLERKLYPLRYKLLLIMLCSAALNGVTLIDDLEIMFTSLLVQALFGQAYFSYISGWRISIGLGILGETDMKYGRDLMGGFVLVGFFLMFFFRGY
ncbi:hypothetical protein ACX1DW_15065 [Stutzerimonas sp. KH-1]|uniref:hypothetical protein n=1 Tax=Stutzerimonas frequens TaxID=2968969 RepID=UPI00190A7A2F|nr:hypothetical protein [Stutzerimonas frequens]MBK3918652.1 hypothetical protein [Stutzerimonas frequens]